MTACVHNIDPDWSCIECCEVIAQREEKRRKDAAAQAAFDQKVAQNLPTIVGSLGTGGFNPAKLKAPAGISFHAAAGNPSGAALATTAKYAGNCLCGDRIDVGNTIYRNKADTRWVCSDCHDDEEDT